MIGQVTENKMDIGGVCGSERIIPNKFSIPIKIIPLTQNK